MDKKLFISHSDKDTTYANLLVRALKKKGIEVFTSQDSLLPGTDWDSILRKELQESTAVVALISDNWSQSTWAATEYGAAYALGKKIIPVLIDDLKDNLFISINKLLTVDAKNEDLESVATQVEEAL